MSGFGRKAKWTFPFPLLLLGLLYSVGEMIQHMMVGPNWLRWHLSDFGFPLSVAMIVSLVTGYKLHPALYVLLGGY